MERRKTKSGYEFWFHQGDDSCLMFLHGMDDYKSMDRVKNYGPLRNMENGWNPSFSIVQPRNTGAVQWKPQIIDEVFDEVVKLGIDPNKLGLTGWSNGGGGVLYYLAQSPKYKMKMAYTVSCYWTNTPTWDNIIVPVYLFHAVNDDVVNVSKSRTAHDKIIDSEYTEYSGGNHSGAQSYTYFNGKPDAERMYAKFKELTNGIEDEIIDNPKIQYNKTKNQLIVEGQILK